MKMFGFNFIFILFFLKYIKADLIDPLSNHKLGTLNEDLKNAASNSTDLGPCHVCRYSAKSFDNFYKLVGREKVKEGIAHWQNNTLIIEGSSTDVLIEIKNLVCKNLKVGKDECLKLFKKHDTSINYWWNHKRFKNEDLIKYLCIETLMICCPDGYYGPSCKPCPGSPFNVCSKKGHCKGDGTKKGSGKCVCHKGYYGDSCEKCDVGFYSSKSIEIKNINDNLKNEKTNHSKSNEPISCLPCDVSCALHCRHKGPRGCEVCKSGYVWDDEYGCIDIDECHELKKNPCSKNTFCVNTEGSYVCYECDKACNGCNGDGPDMCLKCAEDFKLEGKICVNTKPYHQETQMEMSRYVTYLGLCLATCIIFRNNILVASVIGCVVATYIGIAEYTIGGNSLNWFNSFLKNFIK